MAMETYRRVSKGLTVPELESMVIKSGQHGSRNAHLLLEHQLRAYILIHILDTERKVTGKGKNFLCFKVLPQLISSNKTTTPSPSQIVLPTANQIFKHMIPQGAFSFKPKQEACLLIIENKPEYVFINIMSEMQYSFL